jgi:hypothetical protein
MRVADQLPYNFSGSITTTRKMETAQWWEIQWMDFAEYAQKVPKNLALLVSFTDSSDSLYRLVGR